MDQARSHETEGKDDDAGEDDVDDEDEDVKFFTPLDYAKNNFQVSYFQHSFLLGKNIHGKFMSINLYGSLY